MRNKKTVFISILLFMVVLSIGAISAEDVDDAIASSGNEPVLGDSNTVSGGVDVVTENPWNTSGELSYEIPSDATTIKSADVYVNVYSGSATNLYGANANITITTDSNTTKYFEPLWIEEGSTDGTVYIVNDHTTKCYSDYMIHYDITNLVNGLSGTNLKINVDTFQMDGKEFDGKIKLIALILGYDDGDYDSISYWINDDQLWTKQNVTVTFDTDNVGLFTEATLTNVVLSSGDGTYKINNDFLDDADTHVTGNYYQYNQWDVTSIVKSNQKNDLHVLYAGTSAWGSIKNVLSVLTINNFVTGITITPEYTSVPSAYAGTNNTLTVKVNTKKAGNYAIKLLADDVEVNGTEITLAEGENTILLTDPTIRDIDETTVNGAENNMVKYTVEASYNGVFLNSKDVSLPVLYNGNLGYDMEYNVTGFEEFDPITVTGGVVIDIKDVNSYLGSSSMSRTDNWAIDLDSSSKITNAYIYVPYNWFNAKTYTEDINMFNASFNGATVTPIAFYRDQGNLGNYGKYGYGVLIYDVSDLILIGDNSFVLNKVYPTPAVYPSALLYMFNTTGSKITKTVNILNGADLLSNGNNNADRTVKADTEINVDTNKILDATLYIMAASAQNGESNIVFNGNVYNDVWSGTSSTTDLFTTDVTRLIENSNSISFVATGSTILELSQIIVTTKNIPINTTLTASKVTTVYGSDAEFVATLKDEKRNPIRGADVNVALVTGTSTVLNTTLVTNENGQVTLPVGDLDPNIYYATVTYDGDNTYNPSIKENVRVYVKKINTTLTASDVIAVYHNDAKLVATLKDANRQTISNQKVSITVNGKKWDLTTNSKGQVKLSTDNFDVGNYTADITYKTTTYYYASSTTANIIIYERINTTLSVSKVTTVYGSGDKLVVTLKDADGNVVNDIKVKVVVGNLTKIAKTDANGQVSLDISILAPGEYKVATRSATTDIYNEAKAYAKAYVSAEKVNTTLTIPNVDVAYNTPGAAVVATLKDAYGNIVSDVKVKVVVGNLTKTIKTDANGQVSVDISDLTPGEYKVSARSAITTIYNEDKAYAKATVNKIGPTLTIPNVATVYNTSGAVVATLKDNNGNAISDVKVKLVIGDLSKITKTDANGQVSVDISNFAPGTYKIAARSATTDIYNEVKTYAKVTVSADKLTPTLTIPNVATVCNAGNVVATLKDMYGNAISDVKVKLVVGDLSKIAKTDSNGQISLDISGLAPGEYKVSARSATTDIYNEVKAYTKVTVSADKLDPTLTVPNVNIQQGTAGAAAVATLKDMYGNAISGVKVKIVVGDLTKTAKTDDNGQISIDISSLIPGEYKISARSATTDIYNEVKAYAKAIIN